MTNPRMQNKDHLREVAYNNASRLNARITFWQLYGEPHDDAFDRFLNKLGSEPNQSVLDLGCGPAHYWAWGLERDRIPSSWKPTLTDLSPGMLDEASQNLSSFDMDFKFEIADVCDLQFEDESFDIVTANYMLYHARSQKLALEEVARVLKPGGRLLAQTNSERHIVEFLDLQRNFIADESQLDTIGLAHDAFTLENGKEFIEPCFSNVEVITDESICKATDPDIVINYAHSMDAELNGPALDKYVREEIERIGHFAVTRVSGMFVAQK